MPPAWTRAAMLVRTNSLLRGHSGVRWELVQKMVEVIEKGIVPLVPLRGSISASGGKYLAPVSAHSIVSYPSIDLSSLSYIAGTLIGNPGIRVWLLSSPIPSPLPAHISAPTPRFPVSIATSAFTSGAATPATDSDGNSPVTPSTPASSLPDDHDFTKPHGDAHSSFSYSPPTPSAIYTASKALALTNTAALPLASKEHLGILNGTAFSAGLSALVVNGAKDVVVLGAVSTIIRGPQMFAHSGLVLDCIVRGSYAGCSRFFRSLRRPRPSTPWSSRIGPSDLVSLVRVQIRTGSRDRGQDRG